MPVSSICNERQPQGVEKSGRNVHFSDEAKQLLDIHIPINTNRASSTMLVSLCVFIVHWQGLISDFERVLCYKYYIYNRTDERLTLLEFIAKQCKYILFPGPNGAVL